MEGKIKRIPENVRRDLYRDIASLEIAIDEASNSGINPNTALFLNCAKEHLISAKKGMTKYIELID